MKQWWQGLEPGEQRLLRIGGLFLIGVLLYLLAWEPVQRQHQRSLEQVAEQRALLQWMRERALEAQQLRAASSSLGHPKQARQGSLLSVIDRGARAAGLGKAMKRVEPAGGNKARVWLESVSFDPLVTWLGELQAKHGIGVDSMTIDRGTTPGRVDARLVFVDSEHGR
jgi:general secretion pathway protein M